MRRIVALAILAVSGCSAASASAHLDETRDEASPRPIEASQAQRAAFMQGVAPGLASARRGAPSLAPSDDAAVDIAERFCGSVESESDVAAAFLSVLPDAKGVDVADRSAMLGPFFLITEQAGVELCPRSVGDSFRADMVTAANEWLATGMSVEQKFEMASRSARTDLGLDAQESLALGRSICEAAEGREPGSDAGTDSGARLSALEAWDVLTNAATTTLCLGDAELREES